MSYRKNWKKHLVAWLAGDLLSERLARDFWSSDEDLWNPRNSVQHRLWKFFFVYVMSGMAQVAIPFSIVGIAYLLLSDTEWWWILFGGLVCLSGVIIGAVLVALGAYLKILRLSRAGGRQ